MASEWFQLIFPAPGLYKAGSTLAQSSPLALFQAKTHPARPSSATVIAMLPSAFQRPHTTTRTRTWTPRSTVKTQHCLCKASSLCLSPYTVPSSKAPCWKASRLEIVLFSIYWTWLGLFLILCEHHSFQPWKLNYMDISRKWATWNLNKG